MKKFLVISILCLVGLAAKSSVANELSGDGIKTIVVTNKESSLIACNAELARLKNEITQKKLGAVQKINSCKNPNGEELMSGLIQYIPYFYAQK